MSYSLVDYYSKAQRVVFAVLHRDVKRFDGEVVQVFWRWR